MKSVISAKISFCPHHSLSVLLLLLCWRIKRIKDDFKKSFLGCATYCTSTGSRKGDSNLYWACIMSRSGQPWISEWFFLPRQVWSTHPEGRKDWLFWAGSPTKTVMSSVRDSRTFSDSLHAPRLPPVKREKCILLKIWSKNVKEHYHKMILNFVFSDVLKTWKLSFLTSSCSIIGSWLNYGETRILCSLVLNRKR